MQGECGEREVNIQIRVTLDIPRIAGMTLRIIVAQFHIVFS